eukprot:GHVT01075880.1.p1 GENE.GHVT01075880.1~~GHVT01075880.1.p1  ORF type:complete len:600 (-),score=65.21 GHVT01075880.1:2518-4317(-)
MLPVHPRALSVSYIDPDDDNQVKFAIKKCCFSTVVQLVLIACTASFQFGYCLSMLNTSKAWILVDFGACEGDPNGTAHTCKDAQVQGSLFVTSLMFGACVGCFVGGRVTDIGRRWALISAHWVFVFGGLMSAISDGWMSLVFARTVVGVGVGMAAVCPSMYIAEMSPSHSRGRFGAFHQLSITIGLLAGNLLGLAFGGEPLDIAGLKLSAFQRFWWRFMLATSPMLSLVAIILLTFIYNVETPHFLFEKNKLKTAKALLCELHAKEDISQELCEIQGAVTTMAVLRKKSLTVWSALGKKIYRRVILIACTMALLQQLSGINMLMSNSNKLFASLHLHPSTVTYISIGMSLLNVLITIPAIFLVDHLGRRTLMLAGTLGQALSLLLGAVGNWIDPSSDVVRWLSVTSTYLFVVFFAIGYGPVLYVFLHEIFPAEVKQGATSLATAVNWIACIAVTLPSEFLLSNDSTIVFTLFTIASAIAFVFVFFFMKETKGLSIDCSPYFKHTQTTHRSAQEMDAKSQDEGAQKEPRVSLESATTLVGLAPDEEEMEEIMEGEYMQQTLKEKKRTSFTNADACHIQMQPRIHDGHRQPGEQEMVVQKP